MSLELGRAARGAAARDDEAGRVRAATRSASTTATASCTRSRTAARTTTGRSASATGTPRRARSSARATARASTCGRAGRSTLPAYLPVRTFPVRVDDGVVRSRSALTSSCPSSAAGRRRQALRRYHDEEWGRPVRDERGMYERLCLEGFQSGLSWLTILRKRDGLPRGVRRLRPGPCRRLRRGRRRAAARRTRGSSATAGRSRRRSRTRARRSPCVTAGEPLHELFWRHAPAARPAPRVAGRLACRRRPSRPRSPSACARRASGSSAPTTVYAAMQACGVVNDHLAGCWVRDARRARASRLMLDERVLAVLRRLEDEDASATTRGARPMRERSLQIAADERGTALRARRRPGRVRGAGDRRLARLLDDLARRRRAPCRRPRHLARGRAGQARAV